MKSYWENNGKYQNYVDLMEASIPNYGYTDNGVVNAFLALSHLYYDHFNNGGGNIEDCYLNAIDKYIIPIIPNFNTDAFLGSDEATEQEMNRCLEILKGFSPNGVDIPLVTIWFSHDKEQLSLRRPNNDEGWFNITFGCEASCTEWVTLFLQRRYQFITEFKYHMCHFDHISTYRSGELERDGEIRPYQNETFVIADFDPFREEDEPKYWDKWTQNDILEFVEEAQHHARLAFTYYEMNDGEIEVIFPDYITQNAMLEFMRFMYNRAANSGLAWECIKALPTMRFTELFTSICTGVDKENPEFCIYNIVEAFADTIEHMGCQKLKNFFMEEVKRLMDFQGLGLEPLTPDTKTPLSLQSDMLHDTSQRKETNT